MCKFSRLFYLGNIKMATVVDMPSLGGVGW